MAINAFDPWTFVTILILTFSLFLIITGAFTAYFGSGKSRRIGGLLLGVGLTLGFIWGYLSSGLSGLNLLPNGLFEVIVQSIIVIVAAAIGAILAIGAFLLAIMKS